MKNNLFEKLTISVDIVSSTYSVRVHKIIYEIIQFQAFLYIITWYYSYIYYSYEKLVFVGRISQYFGWVVIVTILLIYTKG